ncbi:MAG: hypothetical protein AB8B51_05620 [Sedimentitalea sp.]
MKKGIVAGLGLAVLAGCGGSRLADQRAQAILALPGPQYFAELRVARDLADRCSAYVFDEKLAADMRETRAKSGAQSETQIAGAVDLEVSIKRRSVAAANDGVDYEELNTCRVLNSEVARMTPLSVLVLNKG